MSKKDNRKKDKPVVDAGDIELGDKLVSLASMFGLDFGYIAHNGVGCGERSEGLKHALARAGELLRSIRCKETSDA